jgi:uncharacterized phiE125 gp8 family phage protein
MDRYKLITAPAAEPVSLSEVKSHCRIDGTAEDTLLTSYLLAAREHVESLCGPLISQVLELYLDDFPAGDVLVILKPRVSAVASIKYTDEGGTEATLDASSYLTDFVSHHARVVLKSNASWPSVTLAEANGVIVRFTAGYGTQAENVPQAIKQAIMLLASSLYENRDPVVQGSTIIQELPFAVTALLANYREWGF